MVVWLQGLGMSRCDPLSPAASCVCTPVSVASKHSHQLMPCPAQLARLTFIPSILKPSVAVELMVSLHCM